MTKINFNKKILIKIFTTSSIFSLVLSIFLIYFIRISKYNIKLTIWSDYITQENINDFSDKTKNNVQLNEFNNNEIMLAKSITTRYDMYGSTDYSVKGLYDSDKIQKIDYDKLEKINTDNTKQSFDISKSDTERRFVKEWYNLASKYELDSQNNLYNYAVPFTIGDFKIMLNLQSPIVKDMISNKSIDTYCDNVDIDDINSMWSCDYDVIPQIVNKGGTFLMGNNPRDVMSLGLKANGFSLNDASDSSLRKVKNWYSKIINGIKFQNNELGVTIANPNKWDVAYAFPGDAVLGIIDEWDWEKNLYWHDVIKFTTPRDGVNLWFDTLSISKDVKDIDAVYEFIEFITKDKVQLGYFDNKGSSSNLYGGVEFIYYQTSSRRVQECETKDPEGRNISEFMKDPNVVPIDNSQSNVADLYKQALYIPAYEDLETRKKDISCTLKNNCGYDGKGFHEFANYSKNKQNKFVHYFNLILAMKS